jgi:hypothetical protein
MASHAQLLARRAVPQAKEFRTFGVKFNPPIGLFLDPR